MGHKVICTQHSLREDDSTSLFLSLMQNSSINIIVLGPGLHILLILPAMIITHISL